MKWLKVLRGLFLILIGVILSISRANNFEISVFPSFMSHQGLDCIGYTVLVQHSNPFRGNIPMTLCYQGKNNNNAVWHFHIKSILEMTRTLLARILRIAFYRSPWRQRVVGQGQAQSKRSCSHHILVEFSCNDLFEH